MSLQVLHEHYLKDIEKFQEVREAEEYRLQEGLESFRLWGLPHNKLEDWRYTSLNSILPENLNIATEQMILEDIPSGVLLGKELNIKPKITQQDSFEALNWACSSATTTLKICAEKNIEEPIVIVHKASGVSKIYSPQLEILGEKNSKASILEIFIHDEGEEFYQRNAVTYIKLEEGSNIEHVKVVMEGDRALHIGKVKSTVAKDAHLNSITVSLLGGLVRNNLEIDLSEARANADVHGVFGLRQKYHHDNFSLIRHLKEDTCSKQLFKGVLGGESRGVFTGKIVVEKDCPRVDSEQLNKNLMLSDKAKVDTRPWLEIETDDVACTHGATIGQVSTDEVFYLGSRGISAEEALKILCHAFVMEVVDKIRNQRIHKQVEEFLFDKFEHYTEQELEQII